MTSGERLEQFVATVDLEGLEEWLVGASIQDLKAARSWYSTARSILLRRYTEYGETWNGISYERQRELPWVWALLAVGLVGPVSAASKVPWERFWATDPHCQERFRRVVKSRGNEWVDAFVPAAAAAHDDANSRVLYETLSPLVTSSGRPTPEDAMFIEGFVSRMWWRDEDTTTELLAEDPLMPELFHHLVASEQLGRSPAVPPAAARMVEKGFLDRHRVIGQAFEALTTQRPATAQRVLAQLLGLLEVTAADIPGGLPFAQGLVATCHGSVGTMLLPLALDLVETPDELGELARTIAGRPERAQKATMLRGLARDSLQARVGHKGVLHALAVFRETSEDQKLLARVNALAAKLGGTAPELKEPGAGPTGLWDLAPPGHEFVSPRVRQWPGINDSVRRGLEMDLSSGWTHEGPRARVRNDLLLAAIVRQAYISGAQLVGALLEHQVERFPSDARRAGISPDRDRPAFSRGILGHAQADWIADPGLESYRAAHLRAANNSHDPPYHLNSPATAFRYLLARESLLRLGRSPRLLSSPSHADHSVAFEVLVRRMSLCQGSEVGPMDLLQALLRLRPTDPSELRQLEGMSLPVDDAVTPTGEPTGAGDAVEVLRGWVLAGGLPRLEPYVCDGRWVSDTVLPLPKGLLALAPPGLLTERCDEIVRIVPRWPDLLLWHDPPMQRPHDHERFNLREIVLGREALPELPTYHAVLHQMTRTEARLRAAGARLGLELMGEGRLDTEVFAQVAVARLDAGVLPVARATAVWELMATSGGLRQLWPAMLMVAEAVCAAPKRPAGTADLLRAMSSLLPEVPAPDVPPALRAFAATKGSTKAHHEARSFVSAADRRSFR